MKYWLIAASSMVRMPLRTRIVSRSVGSTATPHPKPLVAPAGLLLRALENAPDRRPAAAADRAGTGRLGDVLRRTDPFLGQCDDRAAGHCLTDAHVHIGAPAPRRSSPHYVEASGPRQRRVWTAATP